MLTIFKNSGLLDLDLITSFGVSVKTTDNPIGYFGTGLKYAIAVLLREKAEVTLLRGKRRHNFTVKRKIKRGKPFDYVCMDDETLNFTTGLGRNWKTWMALRELYSNCMDEPEGMVIDKATKARGFAKTTQWVIKLHPKSKTSWAAASIALDTKPIESNSTADLHPASGYMYYKGVRICDMKNSLFSYNLKYAIDLTEDRTPKYEWQLKDHVKDFWLQSSNKNFITDILNAASNTYEGKLDFSDSFGVTPTETFLGIAQNLVYAGYAEANKTVQDIVSKYIPDARFRPMEILEDDKINLLQCDHMITLLHPDYESTPVTVVEHLNNAAPYEFKDGHLYLASVVLTMGVNVMFQHIYMAYIERRFRLDSSDRKVKHLMRQVYSLAEIHLFKVDI